MPRFDYIIFDFDGTIADTRRGVFDSISYALTSYGYEVPDEAVLNSFLGPPLYESFQKTLSCNDEMAKKLTEKYRELYTDNAMFRLQLFDGVEEMLKILKENNVRMAIASSKPENFFSKLLEHLSITQYFDVVCGAKMGDIHNTKQQIIARAMNALSAERDKTLMVGDRLFDIEGAKENKIKSAGVVFGFDYREELENAGADFIVTTTKQLLKEVLLWQ